MVIIVPVNLGLQVRGRQNTRRRLYSIEMERERGTAHILLFPECLLR